MRRDDGFTLVEVVIAAVITGVLALAVAQVIAVTETTLTQSAGRAITSTQAVRFGGLLRYDLSGAADVFMFDTTPPTNVATVCSSWSPSNGTSWSDTQSNVFVRPLFTVLIRTLGASTGTGGFAPVEQQRIGYELRGEADSYAVFRVDCSTANSAQRVFSLGAPIPSAVTGLNVLRCISATGEMRTPVSGASTMSSSLPASQRCASFSFVLPDGATELQRQLASDRLQRMSSAVTPA